MHQRWDQVRSMSVSFEKMVNVFYFFFNYLLKANGLRPVLFYLIAAHTILVFLGVRKNKGGRRAAFESLDGGISIDVIFLCTIFGLWFFLGIFLENICFIVEEGRVLVFLPEAHTANVDSVFCELISNLLEDDLLGVCGQSFFFNKTSNQTKNICMWVDLKYWIFGTTAHVESHCCN